MDERRRWRGALGSLQALRALPIRLRVLSLAALNILVVLIFTAVIGDGAQDLTSARNELRQTRESDRLLGSLQDQAERLQGLIHRYFTQPNADLLTEINDLREVLLGTLKNRASSDPILSGSATGELVQATERFVAGFGDLRNVQTTISNTYEHQVLTPAREMSGLYAIVEGATTDRTALIWPALSKSREAFSTTLVLTNVFYLTQTQRDRRGGDPKNLETIEGTIPVMLDLPTTTCSAARSARSAIARCPGGSASRICRRASRSARGCCATASTATRPRWRTPIDRLSEQHARTRAARL